MKILGFSGKKQSGKTIVAEFLLGKLGCSGIILRIAYFLNVIVLRLFVPPVWGWKLFNLEKQENKETKLPCGKTVRKIQQEIGTDIGRNLWGDCWINDFMYEIKKQAADIVIVPNIRFPNEVKCIQDLGGHVIRLLRAPFPEDKHESETALDLFDKPQNRRLFDAVIDNREMDIPTQNEAIWKLVNDKKWI